MKYLLALVVIMLAVALWIELVAIVRLNMDCWNDESKCDTPYPAT